MHLMQVLKNSVTGPILALVALALCKHSLIRIDLIASVYELFDNPSY